MNSQEPTMLEFVDAGSGDAAFALVRVVQQKIAVCLSLEHDGDIEVFFTEQDCRFFVEALQQALRSFAPDQE